jgi:hypothetical protein
MMSFRSLRLAETRLALGTVWLLEALAEAKGRHALYEKQSPQILRALRELALVESTESSNRIEGVTVERDRLLSLNPSAGLPGVRGARWPGASSPRVQGRPDRLRAGARAQPLRHRGRRAALPKREPGDDPDRHEPVAEAGAARDPGARPGCPLATARAEMR